jgi:hypothetical protein
MGRKYKLVTTVQVEEIRQLKLIRKIVLETNVFKKYEPQEFRPGIMIAEKAADMIIEGSKS